MSEQNIGEECLKMADPLYEQLKLMPRSRAMTVLGDLLTRMIATHADFHPGRVDSALMLINLQVRAGVPVWRRENGL